LGNGGKIEPYTIIIIVDTVSVGSKTWLKHGPLNAGAVLCIGLIPHDVIFLGDWMNTNP
jgi:hypothetical protein